MTNLQELANRLRDARLNSVPVAQLSLEYPALTVAEAYEIQSLLVTSEIPTGYKMGLTSEAKQREVGVSTPIRGRLIADGAIANGAFTSHRRYIHPRAEPEIVFLLKHAVPATATPQEVRAAIESVHIGIEIIDSRYRDFKFTLPDVIADNTSAAGYVIGDAIDIPLEELKNLDAWISKNGEVAHLAKASAILGDPLNSLDALLKLTPEGLRHGYVPVGAPRVIPVLAGAVTSSVPFKAGDTIEAHCATGARAWFRVD